MEEEKKPASNSFSKLSPGFRIMLLSTEQILHLYQDIVCTRKRLLPTQSYRSI